MKMLIIIDNETGKATTVTIGNMGYRVFEAEQALEKSGNDLGHNVEPESSPDSIVTKSEEPETEESKSEEPKPVEVTKKEERLEEDIDDDDEEEESEKTPGVIEIEKELKILKMRDTSKEVREKQKKALIDILKKIHDAGQNPSHDIVTTELHIISPGKLYKLFGGFKNALEAAGLPNNKTGRASLKEKKLKVIVKLKDAKQEKKYVPVSKSMIKRNLRKAYKYFEHTPSRAEFKYCKYSVDEDAIDGLFGSYEKAVEAAGLTLKSMEREDNVSTA